LTLCSSNIQLEFTAAAYHIFDDMVKLVAVLTDPTGGKPIDFRAYSTDESRGRFTVCATPLVGEKLTQITVVDKSVVFCV
jgi:hypothetical protein